MSRVMLTKGLPGSGKTTWAREFVSKNPNWKIVCKDDLRSMMDTKYRPKFEKHVGQMQMNMAKYILEEGFNVIVADTNLNPKVEEKWKEQFKVYGVGIMDFTNVPLETCIKQDLLRLDSVGRDVIMDMHNRYLREEVKTYPYDNNLPDCVIIDVDGTVAEMHDRSPYEWEKVGQDKPIQGVIDLVDELNYLSYTVIFLSGRDGSCHQETYKWLCDQFENMTFHLYTRPAGDMRKDVEVKRELFDNHIRDKYNVKYVVDDRPQVCRLWHSMGLTLLKVGDPDLNF